MAKKNSIGKRKKISVSKRNKILKSEQKNGKRIGYKQEISNSKIRKKKIGYSKTKASYSKEKIKQRKEKFSESYSVKKSILIFSLIFICSISILFLTLGYSLRMNIFNEKYYLDSFDKYNVYNNSNLVSKDINATVVDDAMRDAIFYLKGSGVGTNGSVISYNSMHNNYGFYNNKEITHMKDVKFLISLFLLLGNIGLFVLISIMIYCFIVKETRIMIFSYLFGGGLTLVVALVLVLGVFFNFDGFFRLMHETLFTNNLWLLDPATDNMINIFVKGIFFGLGARIVRFIFVVSIMFIFVSLILIPQIGADKRIDKHIEKIRSDMEESKKKF